MPILRARHARRKPIVDDVDEDITIDWLEEASANVVCHRQSGGGATVIIILSALGQAELVPISIQGAQLDVEQPGATRRLRDPGNMDSYFVSGANSN